MMQIEKFRRVMEEISAAKGAFVFFGLFLREEAFGQWDLVISAPWFEAGRRKDLAEFIEKATAIIGKQELIALSRIIALDPHDANLEAVLQAVQVENGPLELWHPDLFGLDIEHAYILRAKRASKPEAAATS